jgi:hypothetical protein
MTRCDRQRWENWAGDVVVERPERHCYPSTLKEVLDVIAEAAAQSKQIRASGSHWALSDVAASPDWFVETHGLSATLHDVVPDALSQEALEDLARHPHGSGQGYAYYHVEAGITIRELSLRLDADPARRWALPTMGGAAGQSLAGAIATGTHGGDHAQAPMADMVQAIHLVTAGAQLWIERDQGITDDAALATALPDVTVCRSSELFDAVLVSAGRMGIVYSLVIRVVEQFSLEQIIVASTWAEQESRLRAPFPILDAAPPWHTGPDPRPTHFVEVVVLPYSRGDGDRSCYVTQRWLGPDGPRPGPPKRDLFASVCSHKVLLPWPWRITVGGLVAAACNLANRLRLSRLVRWLGERLIREFRPSDRIHDVGYNVMDLGRTSGDCYRAASLEVAFDAASGEHVAFMREDVFPTFDDFAARRMTVGGYISMRFTGRSEALLAMQRWDPTCHIEIALLKDVRGNLPILESLQAAAVRRGGTVHWGQRNTLDPVAVGLVFPTLPRWKAQLAQVVGTGGDDLFDNDFCRRHGLEP